MKNECYWYWIIFNKSAFKPTAELKQRCRGLIKIQYTVLVFL